MHPYNTIRYGMRVEVRGVIMNAWFAAAAILSAGICGLHVVMGGREAARPLLAASGLDHVAKFTNYYCWHLVTIVIGALGAAFAYSSWQASAVDIAQFATAIALLFALWSVAMIVRFRLSPIQFPQWALFILIALLGLAGNVV
ncbi:hypothetical protein HZZ13_07055 [Bradyrhizobium sp. CNPSo 4010]|uniref:DUF423 domain-containing protein n=1 Tax=Bradyrhizobium agreste TaxID=2751811 RepID=A0ABS0PK16_9BRAD|nr:hypothetical protein [Bradyrhizobium agreste]MBH5397551.1 hypothetical protein [Bradyrhizobium agreste]